MSLKNPVTLFRIRGLDEYLASRETLPAMVERVVRAWREADTGETLAEWCERIIARP
jgi:hypothetical protein